MAMPASMHASLLPTVDVVHGMDQTPQILRILLYSNSGNRMALDYLLNLKKDKEKLTEEAIAERADLDVRTIQRLRTDDGQNPSKEVVIQLCIAMELPIDISEKLMEKSGHCFKACRKDLIYHMLLRHFATGNLRAANKYLISQGLLPLGKTAKREGTTSA